MNANTLLKRIAYRQPPDIVIPHEFLGGLRIDEAKKLLLTGNHSVTDICFDIGYESLGSFSTKFRSRFYENLSNQK